jgi:DNA replication protein DnaC
MSAMPPGYRELAKILERQIDSPSTMAIGGPRGTGKTTLVWGLVNEFCMLGRSAVYTTVMEYFGELNASPWADKPRVRQRMAGVDLLVLDEIQVRDTEKTWQDNEFTTLIDMRYRERMPTILVSNLLPAAMKDNVGDSVWRRIIETAGEPFVADWELIESVKARRVAAQREAMKPGAKK